MLIHSIVRKIVKSSTKSFFSAQGYKVKEPEQRSSYLVFLDRKFKYQKTMYLIERTTVDRLSNMILLALSTKEKSTITHYPIIVPVKEIDQNFYIVAVDYDKNDLRLQAGSYILGIKLESE